MDQIWRPIAELMPGRYATGQLSNGREAEIYHAGDHLLNIATGQKLAGVISWHVRKVQHFDGSPNKILNTPRPA